MVDIGPAAKDFEHVPAHKTHNRASGLAVLITSLPLVLSRNLWIVPLVGALVIGLVGAWVRGRVEGSMRTELRSRLQTVLNADVEALRLWFSEQTLDAKSFANDSRIREAVTELWKIEQSSPRSPRQLSEAAAATALRTNLTPLLQAQGYLDYVLVSRNRRILASPYRPFIGRPAPEAYRFFLDSALDGRLAVSRPFASETTQDQKGPSMFVAAPVFSTDGEIVAVLGLRMRPEEEFSRIFSVARMGQSGETYAFDRRGVMLTASRFDSELRAQGLIPNVAGSTAILNLRLIDPTSRKQGSPRQPVELRLTRMAAAAIRGISGCDVDGYPNYRGIQVIGAWAWLPELEMGVATEVAVEEAFHTLYMLRQAFIVLFGLLVVSGIGIFAFTLLVERLQRSIRRGSLAARRLGPYVLLQEIGRGANGMVYRARHSLLRRPVAVKLLSPELTDPDSTARFEQEVQMTSQLTHPNTVAVYDYGRTPEGLFYYAMEYLSGIDLHRLVIQFGPQCEGRILYILRQVCGSLAEAHALGIIHRDIKPANIVITRRGGLCDVVKVLDFGLVKAVNRATGKERAVGTPHFMSPEAIEEPASADLRSDLYSVGAVGYWLLTGKTLFEEPDVHKLLERQAREAPPNISQRSGRSVSPDFEAVIMSCLAKDPADRPHDAAALDHALARCNASVAWSMEEASDWWEANLAHVDRVQSVAMPEKTLVIAPRP